MTRVKVVEVPEHTPKRRLHKVKPLGMGEAVRAVIELRKDIEIILDSGITTACLARSLGYTPWTVWAWRHGRRTPRLTLVAVTIREWARILKEAAGKTSQTYPQKEDNNHEQKEAAPPAS